MILDLQSRLAQLVRAAAREAFGVDLETIAFQYPPQIKLGDLALTAPFDLAKTLRRKPRDIAERLATALSSTPGVRRAEVAGGGYVNVFLDRGAFAAAFYAALRDPRPAPARPGTVIVEHTSINPNKAAHIGHLRNATLGDTFVRVLGHLGHRVGIQNYIDDTGVQVADVVVGLIHLERRNLAGLETIPGRFDYYCWDLYARVGDFYAADPGRKALQVETLHAVEAGDNDTARLAAAVAARIVDCHLATMERLGIRYDLLAHESDILRLHFWDRAFALLKEAGAIRFETEGKNKGCWVLTMGGAEAEESEGRTPPGGGPASPETRRASDEDKIIVRSNGTVTYTGKDIAYQLWKLGRLDRDFKYRRHRTYPDGHVLWTTTSVPGEPGAPVFGHARAVYNVIDVGQSYPQRVVKAGVAALGHAEDAEASHHLAYEKVVLSPATARALGYAVAEEEAAVKVSGRKGLGVKADDLLDALLAKARSEIDARDPAREATARERTATAIAIGALRYFLLKFGRTRIITFDMEEALAFAGETGPYLQNAVVRARNIFAKMEGEGHRVGALLERAAASNLGALLEGEEGDEVWSLLLLMARSEEVAEQAVRAEEVALLAKHTFAVAQAFHSYYQNPSYSVLYAAGEERRAFRTLVVDCFLRQMDLLLGLLGIPVPERM
jgi:arginyl-tRNA synthetase